MAKPKVQSEVREYKSLDGLNKFLEKTPAEQIKSVYTIQNGSETVFYVWHWFHATAE